MASLSAGSKPSFAKIAAAGIKPASTHPDPSTTERTQARANNAAAAGAVGAAPTALGGQVAVSPSPAQTQTTGAAQAHPQPAVDNSIRANRLATSNALHVPLQSQSASTPLKMGKASLRAALKVSSSDSDTQLSSSSGPMQPSSIGGKSNTSAATFALDEKESLRPDDSASAKAAEDEDSFAPPGAGPPNPHAGSDQDVAAFREQLREITGIETERQSTVPQPFRQTPDLAQGVLYVAPQGIGVGAIPNVHHASTALNTAALLPDQKLLEALESPKDRIMVLKLEQDIVDFVKDPKETSLKLPQTNAFYRMLAHKLADYYVLGHTVDDSTQAVRIFKTVHCRIPPPLTDIATTAPAGISTPIVGSQMKILRRGDTVGSSTANGSGTPSMATSETGESGTEDDKRPKPPATREEREARYEAARKRIMGSSKLSEAAEELLMKDNSRSSSTTGKKNANKKKQQQRAGSDDDFEARSAYSPYYPPPPFGSAGPSTPFSGVPSYGPSSNTQMLTGPKYGQDVANPAYPHTAIQEHTSWPYQQYRQQPDQMIWPQSQPQPYDLAADFQRAISLQNNMAHMPPQFQQQQQQQQQQQPGPSMDYNSPYNSPQQMWPQQAYAVTGQGQMSNIGYAQPFPNRPVSASSQHQEYQPYAFGQLPSQNYSNRTPANLDHPLPGSYKSKHFNPQSQSFVPGHVAGSNVTSFPSNGIHSNSPMPIASFASPAGFPPAMQQHYPALASSANSANVVSPAMSQQILGNASSFRNGNGNAVARTNSHLMTHPLPQPVFACQAGPQNPLPPRPEAQQPLFDPSQMTPTPNNASSRNTGPTTTQSSIAKWGTPASLPPKPPPSAEAFESARFAPRKNGMQHFGSVTNAQAVPQQHAVEGPLGVGNPQTTSSPRGQQ